MTMTISPQEAQRLVQEEGAVLIDVRDADEFGNTRIPGARLQPLSVLRNLPEDGDQEKTAIYFCRSGKRTTQEQAELKRRGHTPTYILEGGLLAWQQAGLPVETTRGPLPLMRQVHLVVGGLVALCTLLGTAWPFFLLFPILMGAGLVYSGLTGHCGMAMLLSRMPWNTRR